MALSPMLLPEISMKYLGALAGGLGIATATAVPFEGAVLHASRHRRLSPCATGRSGLVVPR